MATSVAGPAKAVVTEAELKAAEVRREAAQLNRLDELAPGSAAAYREAVTHAHAGRLEQAEVILDDLHHEAPGFTVATRRLCLTKGALGKSDAALPLCREAAGDDTATSLAALAYALTGFGSREPHPEALAVARRAVDKDADDVLAQRAFCLAARNDGDPKAMRGCTQALERLDTAAGASAMWLDRARLLLAQATRSAEPDPVMLDESAFTAKRAAAIREGWAEPAFVLADIALRRNDDQAMGQALARLRTLAADDPRTWRLEAIHALAHDEVDEARHALERALELGLDPDAAASLERQIDERDPVSATWLPILGAVIAVSAGGLALYARRKEAT